MAWPDVCTYHVPLFQKTSRPDCIAGTRQEEPRIHCVLDVPGLPPTLGWNLMRFLSIEISHNALGPEDRHQPQRLVLTPTQLRKYLLGVSVSVSPAQFVLSATLCHLFPLSDNLSRCLPNKICFICYFWRCTGEEPWGAAAGFCRTWHTQWQYGLFGSSRTHCHTELTWEQQRGRRREKRRKQREWKNVTTKSSMRVIQHHSQQFALL